MTPTSAIAAQTEATLWVAGGIIAVCTLVMALTIIQAVYVVLRSLPRPLQHLVAVLVCSGFGALLVGAARWM